MFGGWFCWLGGNAGFSLDLPGSKENKSKAKRERTPAPAPSPASPLGEVSVNELARLAMFVFAVYDDVCHCSRKKGSNRMCRNIFPK